MGFNNGSWAHNDKKYPKKKGVCDHCGQRDDIKLSFDQIHWICINDHACMLRWGKQLARNKDNNNG